MRTRTFPAHLAVALLGILLTIGGALAMRAELTPYLTARSTSTGRVVELAHGGTDTGLSIASRQMFLFDCRVAMTSIASRAQPSNVRRSLVENCLARSDEIAAQSPTFSIAWLTGAMAAAEAEDWDGFNERLRRCYVTGPLEQWIAEMRVAVAEENFTHLSKEALALHQADLQLLVFSERGIRSIAHRYLSAPDFQARVASIVETMSEDDQKRFLRRLRRAVPNGEQ